VPPHPAQIMKEDAAVAKMEGQGPCEGGKYPAQILKENVKGSTRAYETATKIEGAPDAAVVAIYEKAFDDHCGDKAKVCAALGLSEEKWVGDLTKEAFVAKFLGGAVEKKVPEAKGHKPIGGLARTDYASLEKKSAADPAVVAIYEKAYDDHGGDRAKVCAALGLVEAKWDRDLDKEAFVKKFLG